MNRPLFLIALSFVIGGCAADFSEDGTSETTNAPESSEQTTSEPTVNVYGGRLQRPAETIGSVDEATQTVNARAIRNYVGTVEQVETELGPKFNRSMTQ
jgi:uncharacterized lipoprotein YajG